MTLPRIRLLFHGSMPATLLVSAAGLLFLAGCLQVTGVDPPQGCTGQEEAVLGSGFGSSQGASVVRFNGIDAGAAAQWSGSRITVAVPPGATSGPVTVEVGGHVSRPVPFEVGTGLACRVSLIPGPAEPGYDADLERLARLYDRQFHVFNAAGMGLNSDVVVALDRTEDRDLIHRFLEESDGWDFPAFAGKSVFDTVTAYQAVAGLYAGVGIVADAYRYGVLRDEGYDAAEVSIARQHLLDGLEGLHVAIAITGTPGVIARGFLRKDIPGSGATTPTTPLFDENGNPLPPEKNNGESRADNSGGLYPNYIWTDSCSRDQLIGWAAAFGGAWEVIRDDATFPEAVKDRMRADAAALGRMLSTVQASGYDLEIQDADGRPTFHAYLNEHAFDRIYLPWLPMKDGMYSLMSLGIIGALAYASEDPALQSYLVDALLGARGLSRIAAANQIGVDLGVASNYSSVNMAFMGAFLASRYIENEEARADFRTMLRWKLYSKPFATRQPLEIGQSFFDFTFAAGMADSSASRTMSSRPDADAMARGLQTLREFPRPPFWEIGRTNCDEAEIAAKVCIADDGTRLDLLGFVGRGDKLVSKQPVPMRTRPPSNYFWRSNPYEPNGESDGTRLLPGVDFRFAYWLGRWTR